MREQAAAAGPRFVEFSLEPSRADLVELADLADRRALSVAVQETLPLAEAAKAHELSESGRVRGKIVLVP
ncbi:zinc-binding dehydrogenase [Streptomyces sp. NBC_00448]|uniref:zinc-binding dehydrogenase n=1 Tax=Streptomyces sp. NBC_00448 TaxID=2903652 RepID=UPI002E1F2EC7